MFLSSVAFKFPDQDAQRRVLEYLLGISRLWYVLIQAFIDVERFTMESRSIKSAVSVRLHHHFRGRSEPFLDPAAV